ncbi:trigger factor [Marinobacter sp. M3C]|jgi:trigger factor|uniref:trigger factor n=1 Tax=unclassified Marinobacter TaxID=83889 RepID=UPI002010A88D|nr:MULTISPECIES: trigger factor [unclassified Marinobacter]MCL1477896.1 trigger factor [Marinobacter sp.]MCL1481592.1 trigger factor [Marinobacter sp.]MCL1485723.1 trigger factor [Marinobacter sp.]MCL1486752.1 trigger factor [Marinobacter sp.]UQG54359.1 trigger factor [Marinobacter sp. M4C]
MQVSVETTSSIERHMTIGVPAQEIDQAVQKRLQETARTVRLNGFRPGKVPMSVVKRRFGGSVRQEIVGEIMRDNYVKALQEQDLNPAGWPRFEPKTMEEGKDLEFVAIFEVLPEIELGDLSAVTIEKPQADVTDADIDTMIDNLRTQQATMKSVKRKAKNKDIAVIDFKGTIDGEEFEGGAAEKHRLTLGSGQMIPGFEKAIVGSKAGEELEIDVTFPEDYHNEELKGKPVKFQVMIHEVEEPQLPELDAEFFKKFGIEAEDEAAFRVEVKKNMERELKQAISNKVKNDVVDALLNSTELDVPTSLVDQEIDRLRQDAVKRFGGQMDFQQLPKEIFEEQATRRVKTGLLFQEVVKKNELTADAEKVEEKIQEIASTYEQPEEVIAHFNSSPEEKSQIESTVLEDAVVEYVLGQAQVTEKAMKYEEAIQAGQTQR